jgi:hypothetical protein
LPVLKTPKLELLGFSGVPECWRVGKDIFFGSSFPLLLDENYWHSLAVFFMELTWYGIMYDNFKFFAR